VPGSTEKVCQLTGEVDRELGAPTLNRTESRYGLWGTDLGSSFEHDGRLWVLFGDSIPTGPGTPNPSCGNAIALSEDVDPADCVSLDFLAFPDGTFRSPAVPGVELACFDVPLDGVSAGRSVYVWFSTAHMTRSVLARSDDGAASFELVHDFSERHFVNVSADVVGPGELPGLPEGEGDRVLLFGSGTYRKSDVRLATVPLARLEDRAAIRFFAGLDEATCTPVWSRDEADAVALFDTDGAPGEEGCVGELSVHRSEVLDQWIVLHNCAQPRGIGLRTAARPWGPWSAGRVAFHPWDDDGYCHFMHTARTFRDCDEVHDPGREEEWGGEYGPYVLERYTTGDREGGTLYYVMSTWNPYNTVVMRTQVRRAGRE